MRAVIGCDNADVRDKVRQVITNSGWQCAAEDGVPPDDIPLRLSQVLADLAVVVLDDNRQASLQAIQYAARKAGLPVVAVGLATAPDQIQDVRSAGAREVVEWGRLKEDLRAILEQLSATEGKVGIGRSIAVLGSNPGCGATTIASGLAFAFGATRPGKVVLAELGEAPELALDLHLEPRHSVADLVQAWDRLDHSAVRRSVAEHARGVALLGYPQEGAPRAPLDAGGVRQLTVLLRTLFEVSVLDLGHHVTSSLEHAAALSDAVVLVVRLDVPSLRIARRVLRELKGFGVPRDRVHLVVNRYGQRQQLPWQKAEEHLEHKVVAWIPDDPSTVNYALNHGVPLKEASRSAKITRAMDELAKRLAGKT